MDDAVARLMEAFRSGGPVMWPILALSLAGMAILARNFLLLLRGRTDFRGMGVVNTIITAEPMLGILGTVTGIIQTFRAFQPGGEASPLLAAGGVGEALITTAAGLIAALLLLFPYNYLASKGGN